MSAARPLARIVKVVTPKRLVSGEDGINAPRGGHGSASTLPMTDDEMAAAAARDRVPFGFQPAPQPSSHRRRV